MWVGREGSNSIDTLRSGRGRDVLRKESDIEASSIYCLTTS